MINKHFQLLIVLILVTQIHNSKPFDLNDSFEFLKLSELEKEFRNLEKYRQFLRIQNAFDRYPELTQTECKGKPCWIPIIEMTNFDANERAITHKPTVIITSGMHGFDLMGGNIIFYMIDFLLNTARFEQTWRLLIDNIRIIFLPNLNAFGLYNRKAGEVFPDPDEDDEERRVDTYKDFNFLPPNQCFLSNTAKIIGRLFKDNLIFGILNYGNSSHPSILTPWNKLRSNLVFNKTVDLKFFESAKKLMAKSSLHKNIVPNEQRYNTKVESAQDIWGEGNIEDWAFGGSTATAEMSSTCLPPDSPYNESFLKIDNKSNRSFAVRLNHGYSSNKNVMLGTKRSLNMIDLHVNYTGFISRNVIMLKQFLEIIQPFYYIRNLWSGPRDPQVTSQQISMHLTVFGCQSVSVIKLKSPIPLTQNFYEASDVFINSSIANQYDIMLSFKTSDPLWNNPVDFIFDIVCDHEFVKDIDGSGKPISNVLQMRQAETLEVRKDQWVYKNEGLRKLVIYGYNISLVSNIYDSVLHQTKFYEAEMIYTTNFDICINGKAQFVIEFLNGSYIKVKKKEDGDLDYDDLEFTIYVDSNYFYMPKDDSVLKSNWRAFDESESEGEKPQETIPKNEIIGVKLKLEEDLLISRSVFPLLLGKRVLIHSKGKPLKEGSQGRVNIPESLPKEKYRGLLVGMGGVSCRSDSDFSAGTFTEDVKFYKLYIKQKKESISIKVELDMDNPPDSLVFSWKEKRVELFKVSKNEMGQAVYLEEVDRVLYPIVGTFIKILNKESEQIIKCFPEKSLNASKAKSLEEAKEEFWIAKQNKLKEMQIKSAQNEGTSSLTYILMGAVFIGLIVSGPFVFGMIRFEKKKDLEEELDEDLQKDGEGQVEKKDDENDEIKVVES